MDICVVIRLIHEQCTLVGAMEERPLSLLSWFILLSSGCLSTPPPDLDGDGISDSEDLDDDGDGWNDDIELNCSTDPLDGDSFPEDEDWDLICSILDDDDDGDDWSDSEEEECSTDPKSAMSVPTDLDSDGLCDVNDEDADGDGLPNIWEVERGFDPMDPDDYMSCHGESVYCMRSYDDFTFPETHNAYSSVEAVSYTHLTLPTILLV